MFMVDVQRNIKTIKKTKWDTILRYQYKTYTKNEFEKNIRIFLSAILKVS